MPVVIPTNAGWYSTCICVVTWLRCVKSDFRITVWSDTWSVCEFYITYQLLSWASLGGATCPQYGHLTEPPFSWREMKNSTQLYPINQAWDEKLYPINQSISHSNNQSLGLHWKSAYLMALFCQLAHTVSNTGQLKNKWHRQTSKRCHKGSVCEFPITSHLLC